VLCKRAGKGGGSLCNHERPRSKCAECQAEGTGGGSRCGHGNVRSVCAECLAEGTGGGGRCGHGNRRSTCAECLAEGTGGGSRCGHGNLRSTCAECQAEGTGGGGRCGHGNARSKCAECQAEGTGGGSRCGHGNVRSVCALCLAEGTGGGALCEAHGNVRSKCIQCIYAELYDAAVETSVLGDFGEDDKKRLEASAKEFVHGTLLAGMSTTIAEAIKTSSASIYVGKGTPSTLDGDQCDWCRDEDIDWLKRESCTIYSVEGRTLKKAESKNIFKTIVAFRSPDPRRSYFYEAAIHREMERIAAEHAAPRGVVATRRVGAGNKAEWALIQAAHTGTPILPSGVFVTYASLTDLGESPYHHDELGVEVLRAKMGDAKLECLLTQQSPSSSRSSTATPSDAEDAPWVRDLEDQKFYFTGTIPDLPRKAVQRLLTTRGAKCPTNNSGCSSGSILVVGAKSSSAPTIKRAEKRGATIMSAEEFLMKYVEK